MYIGNVLTILMGVSLFLLGMSLMGEGLKNVAGSKLEGVLWRLSGTPVKGLLTGTAVTTFIQSSSATTIMAVGFLNPGIMQLAQAISIVLGANIGTSVTGWVLCLSYVGSGESSGWLTLLSASSLAAMIAVVGIAMRMFSKKTANKHIAGILLGFAILMFGMQTMSAAVEPLKNNEGFRSLMTSFSNPFLGILAGIVVTAILQSNSASVGILQALSMAGLIKFSTAFPIVLGMGIGAATPILLSAISANKDGKRTALSFLFKDVFGAVVWGSLFYIFNAIFHFSFMDATLNPVTVAILNTAYRVVTAVLLVFFIPQIEKLLRLLVPDKEGDRDQSAQTDFARLDERFLSHPALAIEQCRLVLANMATKARGNFDLACSLLDNYTKQGFDEVQMTEDEIDRYEDKLGTYLMKLTGKDMPTALAQEMSKILHTISDFERISDHAVNISEVAQEIYEKKLEFSFEGKRELEVLRGAVSEIIATAVEAFNDDDIDKSHRVEPLEQIIDILCDEMKLNHVNRIRKGNCSLNQGFVFNDLLTNYERVADHCSNLAVAMIELHADSFDTHQYLISLKEMRDSLFDRYFE